MEKDKTIKIFLASSNELKEEREKFGNFIRGLDNNFEAHGMRIKVFMWEDYPCKWTGSRKQNEYNREVRKSDYFLALFHAEGGDFTIEEFDEAMDEYQKSQSPNIYVYMKDLQEDKQMSSKLEEFKKRLDDIGLYWTPFYNQDSLRLHFFRQFLMEELDSIVNLKLEENGEVKLGGETVAKMDNRPFAAGYKDYQRISAELSTLPKDIENARQYLNEHPDNDFAHDELQKKINHYNDLKKEFAELQNTMFKTSLHIEAMQREQLSDKLRSAAEAFDAENIEKANTLLDEIVNEAELYYNKIVNLHETVHQGIEALLFQAKARMEEVNTPIEERIKQVQAIYVKANKWAKNSAFPEEKYDSLLDDYAKFLKDYGLYKEAELVYIRLISLREELHGEEYADTATSYNNIGLVYYYQGDYAKALEYHRKALDIYERVLGPDHPDTASSYNNIGMVYDNQGDYPKALEYYKKALDIKERVLGPDNPSTATSYNNIGAVYYRRGDYPKALEYYGKALDIKERVLGPDNPDTAQSYNNIGMVYDNQGDYAKALEYYMKDLDICERVLGRDHPDTARAYNNIGWLYYSQGDYAKALEYHRKALDIREWVLGPDHPDTAASYNNIGAVYRNQGDYVKALEHFEKALDISKRVLGPDHPLTVASYNNIGAVYRNQGDYVKALEHFEKARFNFKLALKEAIKSRTINIEDIKETIEKTIFA